MKLSIVISVPDKNALAEQKQFGNKIKKIADLGYQGVELAIRDPKTINQSKLKKMLNELNLKVVSITTGQVFSKDKLSLSDKRIKNRRKAIQRIKNHISLAAIFKSQVLIGWVRGNWHGSEQSNLRFVKALKECAKFAQKKGVILTLEPINNAEIDCLHTIAETRKILEKINLPNTGLIADTYHMHLEEDKPIYQAIKEAKRYLKHVHLADNDRLAPGQGHMPFQKFFAALKKMNYRGWFSVEAFKPNFQTVAKLSINYLKKFI